MLKQRLAENFVRKAFFVFEIFSFEVDAYMYIQKTVGAQGFRYNFVNMIYRYEID